MPGNTTRLGGYLLLVGTVLLVGLLFALGGAAVAACGLAAVITLTGLTVLAVGLRQDGEL